MKEPKTNRGFYREPKGSSDSTHYQNFWLRRPSGYLDSCPSYFGSAFMTIGPMLLTLGPTV